MKELEIGKVYFIRAWCDSVYLFKKAQGKSLATGSQWVDCRRGRVYRGGVGVVTLAPNEVVQELRLANTNELAFWNRTFNEYIEIE